MNIYKLNYPNKETAIADLLAKKVYVQTEEEIAYGQGIHAVVEVGVLAKTQGTYDVEGNAIIEPVYYDGYNYDIMSEQEIDFGSNEIFPNSPKHSFAGY